MSDNKAFYDTNILIAFLFREEERFNVAKRVLESHVVRAMSIISLHEIHLYSIRFDVEAKFFKIKKSLLKLFTIVPLNQEVCIKASALRISYRLPEVDSLIFATAVCNGYSHFYTFDRDFRELNGKRIERTVVHWLS
ncbi:MAG: PIN domain-containing protein [Thermoprotei archaeon]|nr:PIN domain-containing protein [Thermoprotei archaeon]